MHTYNFSLWFRIFNSQIMIEQIVRVKNKPLKTVAKLCITIYMMALGHAQSFYIKTWVSRKLLVNLLDTSFVCQFVQVLSVKLF